MKNWLSATSLAITHDALIHYRVERPGASTSNTAKAYCVCDEFASIDSYMASHNTSSDLVAIMQHKRYETYDWNYRRIDQSLKPDFLKRFSDEFLVVDAKDELDKKYFKDAEWSRLQALMANPEAVFERDQNEHLKKQLQKKQAEVEALQRKLKSLQGSRSYRLGRALTALPRKLKGLR